MGHLFYGSAREPLSLPDLSLAYLQTVAIAKLRRSETFFASWRPHPEESGNRSYLWFHPSIPLMFVMTRTGGVVLDSAVLERLMRAAAASSQGIDLDGLSRPEKRAATWSMSPVSRS